MLMVYSCVLAYIPCLFIPQLCISSPWTQVCTVVPETFFSMLSLSFYPKMLVTLFISYLKAKQIGWLIRKIAVTVKPSETKLQAG